MTEHEHYYVDFINGLTLKNFSGEEFLTYARRKNSGGYAGIPPQELWSNIIPTIQVIDLLRSHLKSPIKLTSIYRSNGYNQAVGGATNSLHKHFRAIDFQVTDRSPRHVFNELSEWRSMGVFRGGLGVYSSFVHIDTRGHNVTWEN